MSVATGHHHPHPRRRCLLPYGFSTSRRESPESTDVEQALNRTRMNFLEEFQKMIDEYNAGSANVETFFTKLLAFTMQLTAEEKRGIAEQLSEEELAIFDLLTKPEVTLTKQEEREVRKVAKPLLQTVKQGKLVLDWRKTQTARA